jgi:hypothetical protein
MPKIITLKFKKDNYYTLIYECVDRVNLYNKFFEEQGFEAGHGDGPAIKNQVIEKLLIEYYEKAKLLKYPYQLQLRIKRYIQTMLLPESYCESDVQGEYWGGCEACKYNHICSYMNAISENPLKEYVTS